MPQTLGNKLLLYVYYYHVWFSSIQNPYIQFHIQASLPKDYVVNARNQAVTQYLENSCIDKVIYKKLVTRTELTDKG